jgi:RNA polymerase sigma-70 factor (ECF subfamily)
MDKNQYFETIYKEYFPKIYDYIRIRIRNPAVAEELAEDVFISVYKNLHVYDENRSFIATWLYAIAGNRLKNYYKSWQYREYNIEDLEAIDYSNIKECRNDMEQVELRLVLDCLIRKLPKRNRQIVYMKYYHNMTSREIGKIMNLSSCNVRIILKRSLNTLRKQLRREGH